LVGPNHFQPLGHENGQEQSVIRSDRVLAGFPQGPGDFCWFCFAIESEFGK